MEMNRGLPNPRFLWTQGQLVEMEDELYEGAQNVKVTESPIQLHSMEIQPSPLPAEKHTERMMELLNHPQSGHWNRTAMVQTVGFAAPTQIVQPMANMREDLVTSPETPKKKKKEKKDKHGSPSNSPKGRGRYACLLHRQKHKRCPPDCPERKPKPNMHKSPSLKKRKPKLVQINPIDLNGSEMVEDGHHIRTKGSETTLLPVEKLTWDTCNGWEELSWNELNPMPTWNAWEDLRSSTHWEESKGPAPRTMVQAGQKISVEFDTNQFLVEEKGLQLSDSPEGGGTMSDALSTVNQMVEY